MGSPAAGDALSVGGSGVGFPVSMGTWPRGGGLGSEGSGSFWNPGALGLWWKHGRLLQDPCSPNSEASGMG